MKQQTFVLEKTKYGAFRINFLKFTIGRFTNVTRGDVSFTELIESLKEGERIEIRKVK